MWIYTIKGYKIDILLNVVFNFIQPENKAKARDLKIIGGLLGSLPIYCERHYHIEFAKEKDTIVFQSNTTQQLVMDTLNFCEGILNSLGIMRCSGRPEAVKSS